MYHYNTSSMYHYNIYLRITTTFICTSTYWFNPYSSDRPRSRRGGRNGRDRGVRFDTRNKSGGMWNSEWYKITIPYGKNYEKDLLLKTIQSLISCSFNPIHYHHAGKNSFFYVNDQTAAQAIKGASGKATLPNGFKMITIVNPSSAPTLPSLDTEAKEKLKVVMSNRYTAETKTLNLGSLYKDSDLQSHGLYMALNRPVVMTAVVEIIKEYIPEMCGLILSSNKLTTLKGLSSLVSITPNLTSLDLSVNELKTIDELDRIKDWNMQTLNLNHNVLCDYFRDRSSYISAVRKRFKNIQTLDGNALPPTIKFDLETNTTLPSSKGSFFCQDSLQTPIVKFLKDYYEVYDTDNRQPLINAYHEQATFSVSAAFNSACPYRQPNLADYNNESRNLIKQNKNYDKNFRLLKQGRVNIVSQLCLLPKTTHDLNSFTVDVGITTDTLLTFSLCGVFKENESKTDKPLIRAFSRQFVAVPNGTSMLITNDMLTVTNALPEQQQSAFKNTGPTPSSSPVSSNPPTLPTDMSVSSLTSNMSIQVPSTSSSLTSNQQEMIKQFSVVSKMNMEWSARCLEENNWEYEKAGQIFLELQQAGKIPPEAFIQK